MNSATKISDEQSQNSVVAFGRKWPMQNVFAMRDQDITAVLTELKDSEDDLDIYLSRRLRAALSYLRQYNAKTNEPIMVLKIVVKREQSRKRLNKLHPNEYDANN